MRRDAREVYVEVQRMQQNVLVLCCALFDAVVMHAVMLLLMWVSGGSDRWVLGVLLAIFGYVAPVLLLRWKMTTAVTLEALIVRYWLFPTKTIALAEITGVEAVTYNPWASGGWGYRHSRRYRRVLNVSGDRGVHVRWGGGAEEQCLVGSRDPEALVEAIEAARAALLSDGVVAGVGG